MKVLLVTPNFHQPRGNTVTVQRIANGLKKFGVQTEIISVTNDSSLTTLPQADLVHGFHAYKFYTFMENLADRPKKFVITITGTDLNHDLFDENHQENVLRCLQEAKAIHVFDQEAKRVLQTEDPNLGSKISIIHQGASNFSESDLQLPREENTFLFVLPAGIRKVKNIPFAIEMLDKLHDKFPSLRLWLVGPVIEEEEGEVVKKLVAKNKDWVTYIGQLEHAQMSTIYKQADAILNTSHTEGQPAAIIEGMGYGLAVLVSNNLGNRNIVTHGRTGMIYDTPSQFVEYAEQIMRKAEWRKQIGQAAKQYISEKHSSEYEAKQLFTIYNTILDNKE